MHVLNAKESDIWDESDVQGFSFDVILAVPSLIILQDIEIKDSQLYSGNGFSLFAFFA